MTPQPDRPALQITLQRDGFAFVKAEHMHELLPMTRLSDWDAFANSWNDLAPDTYLAAQGRQRRRRHSTFSIMADGELRREPHQPHYQSLKYNSLQGDIQRWFQPIEPALADGASLRCILQFTHQLFASMVATPQRWHVETHQFRIEARVGEPGEPTPEGVHRDGVDYVLVLLIDRRNIDRGITTIHASNGDEGLLGSFTLTHPLDAALVDDARVCHGVTAVSAIDPTQPAHRDVLVVTFKAVTQERVGF
ncbi:MAG: 2OG-Fe dioxygenase family protein [Rhodanobacter sp.]